MKTSTLLLSASLAANLALAAVCLNSRPSASSTPLSATGSPSVSAAKTNYPADTSAFPSATVRLAASGGPSLWQQLHTNNPEQLATRLKQAGFPGLSASSIAMQLFQEKNRLTRAAIMGEPETLPYWKEKTYVRPTPEQQARLNELSKESELFMAEYYSAAALDDLSSMNTEFRRAFGELPPEKVQQLLRIQQDYARMQTEIIGPGGIVISSSDPAHIARAEKSALLEKELLADMRELLSPEEFAEFERRSSPTAHRLQQQTSLFRPTEQEYKALFAIHRAIDEQLGIGLSSFSHKPDSEKSRAEALKNAGPQLEAALGPDRYADYLQATNQSAQQLNRLLARLDIPLRTATQIESVRTDLRKRGQELRASAKKLPRDEQIALAQSLMDEAKQKLSPLLGGQRGLDAYIETAGSWLREVPTP
jgi:hypothetical protein